jgi:hypothetical protein
MDMGGATSIVAWVDGSDLDDSLRVGKITPPQEAVDLDVSGPASGVAAIDTRGVASPEFYECVGHGLAGTAVDQADVEDDGNTTEKKHAVGANHKRRGYGG